jgi:hypothetical protein
MAKPNAPSRSLTIRLPTDLYTRLQICALEKQRQGDGAPVPVTQVVCEALETYLGQHERLTQRKTQRKQQRPRKGLEVGGA